MASKEQAIRLVFWNIRHGGGRRAEKIVEQIKEWNPDIVALAEFRGTPPSASIAKCLSDAGYEHQLTTAFAENPRWNALFIGARAEVAQVQVEDAPKPDYLWLLAKVNTVPAIHVGVVHVPLMSENSKWAWLDYYKALLKVTQEWQLGPGLIIGDMNSGLNGLDEETEYSLNYKDTLMTPMEARGWRDIFRAFHPHVDAPTWFSPKDRGFRLDQAFVNDELQQHITSCVYDWGCVGERGKVSDHAALLLDLKLAG